jgi:hypothetical protein
MTDSVNPTNDCNESQESIDKKILNEFKKYEKGFDGKSKPVYWNHCGEKTTLKKYTMMQILETSLLPLLQ